MILAVRWTIAGLLTIILAGFLLFPVIIVLTFVPFVHMGSAAQLAQPTEERWVPTQPDILLAHTRS